MQSCQWGERNDATSVRYAALPKGGGRGTTLATLRANSKDGEASVISHRRLLLAAIGTALAVNAACGQAPDPVEAPRVGAASATAAQFKVPLRFEPNLQQVDDPTSTFIAKAAQYTASLSRQGVRLVGSGAEVRVDFLGSDANSTWSTGRLAKSKSRYSRRGGTLTVPNYETVRLDGAYSGIDVIFMNSEGRLRFDFMVAPGADPALVQMQLTGAPSIYLDARGDVVAEIGQTKMRLSAPVAYQEIDGERQPVEASFAVADDGTVRLVIGAYDESRPLVIDPTVEISGDTAGSMGEVATDGDGNIILGGTASISTISTALLVKLHESGDVAWTFEAPSSQLGSRVTDVAAAPDGTIYAAFSGDAGFISVIGSVIVSFSPAGDVLWAKEVFPLSREMSIGLDDSGDIYVASEAGELVKLSAVTQEEVYRTQVVDSSAAVLRDIAVTGEGVVYAVGSAGPGLATFGPLSSSFGGGESDAFIASVDQSGAVMARAYLGGDGEDDAWGVAAAAQLHVVGMTTSTDLPTRNAVQPSLQGGLDAFAATVDLSAGEIGLLTYLGGQADDRALSVVARENGALVIGGSTNSDDFPTVGALQETRTEGDVLVWTDAFIVELAPDGALLFSTYWGGEGLEAAADMALDPLGRLVVTGGALFTTLPEVNAPDLTGDSFILRLTLFDAAFSTPGGNNWWVEVYVDANEPLVGVDARVDGGAWRALTLQSWGAWAESFFVPDRSRVEFRARSETGAMAISEAYLWPSGSLATDTDAETFDAQFFNVRGNNWWVETDVSANKSIVDVRAVINGTNYAMERTDWGSWAVSVFVPDGSIVQFSARSLGDFVDVSEEYLWPDAVVIDDDEPSDTFDATFSNVRGNNWWVEADVSANETLAAVNARVDGGDWMPLSKTDWGSWAASFFVPTGATVEFQAVSIDADTDLSASYTWPP